MTLKNKVVIIMPYKEKGLKMYNELIRKLKKVYKTQSMKVVLSKMNTDKTLSEFKKLSINDMMRLITRIDLDSEYKIDLIEIVEKIKEDLDNADNENYNPCVGAETFPGVINFNYAVGCLIKTVKNSPDCYKLEITMENGQNWFKYGTKKEMENIVNKVKEMKGWF